MLNPEELERYARHIVMREVGGPGQGKLKAARVLVVGAGGLGAPVLMYLAAAGVGTLGVIDDDIVSLSNLQRQVIHATADVGRAKTDRMCRFGPTIRGSTPATPWRCSLTTTSSPTAPTISRHGISCRTPVIWPERRW
jgi:adenylyltransferase/sulfurtransferase